MISLFSCSRIRSCKAILSARADPEILYLNSFMRDGASPRCRLTKEQFGFAFEAAQMPLAPSLPLNVLGLCWVPRELAREWIEKNAYRWPAHFEPPGTASMRSTSDENRHFKLLAEAVVAVARRRGVPLDQAWAALKADMAAGELKARCRAKRYDQQQAQWIDTWRDLDPRWFGFIAYECPEDNHLRFDQSAAARIRMLGEQIDQVPEHVREIMVEAVRLDELYPSPTAENLPPSPEAPDDTKAGIRHPSRLKPFWSDARKAAFGWLGDNGYPRPGDGGQAKLERYIAEWLSERGNIAGTSTIRGYVKTWI